MTIKQKAVRTGNLVQFPTGGSESFYQQVLNELMGVDIPFLVGGGFAIATYTGVNRVTKDLDLFVTPGEFPRLLSHLKQKAHRISIEDERWIGKIHSGSDFVDVIFGSANGMVPVEKDWFEHGREADLFGLSVTLLGPADLIWSKALIRDRHRYDGADIANLILRQCDVIDWKRLLAHMDAHWEVLLSLILDFRWVYPSDRNCIPRWLIDVLMQRLVQQLELPEPQRKVCRGRIFSRSDYKHAIEDWGYADIGGEENPRNG